MHACATCPTVESTWYRAAMSPPLPRLVSEAEFLALPESMDKVELLDGEVVAPPAPSFGHQETQGRLIQALRNWAQAQPGPVVVGNAPFDIHFGPGRILQPDVF